MTQVLGLPSVRCAGTKLGCWRGSEASRAGFLLPREERGSGPLHKEVGPGKASKLFMKANLLGSVLERSGVRQGQGGLQGKAHKQIGNVWRNQ